MNLYLYDGPVIRNIMMAEKKIMPHRKVGQVMNMMNSYLKLAEMQNPFWML